MIDLSSKQLRRAAYVKDQIDKLQRELARLLGGDGVGTGRRTAVAPKKQKRRKISAAGRARIAAAARKRWAKVRAAKK